jgi:hypothetical protein
VIKESQSRLAGFKKDSVSPFLETPHFIKGLLKFRICIEFPHQMCDP